MGVSLRRAEEESGKETKGTKDKVAGGQEGQRPAKSWGRDRNKEAEAHLHCSPHKEVLTKDGPANQGGGGSSAQVGGSWPASAHGGCLRGNPPGCQTPNESHVTSAWGLGCSL